MFNSIQVYAQANNLQSLIGSAGALINALIVIAFALALLLFFWGVAVFIYNAGNEKKLEDGKRLMVWGVIALFLASSVWGIVVFLQQAFGVDGVTTISTTPPGGFWRGVWEGVWDIFR